jgi:hypothetical protein
MKLLQVFKTIVITPPSMINYKRVLLKQWQFKINKFSTKCLKTQLVTIKVPVVVLKTKALSIRQESREALHAQGRKIRT